MKRPGNKIGRLDVMALALFDAVAPALGPGHEMLRPAAADLARRLKPGRPGSVTRTITDAVKLTAKVREAEEQQPHAQHR